MILVDLNQVMISNLMAQNRGNLSELLSKDAVRHSILNTIRAFNVKFREEYGEMVLCDLTQQIHGVEIYFQTINIKDVKVE